MKMLTQAGAWAGWRLTTHLICGRCQAHKLQLRARLSAEQAALGVGLVKAVVGIPGLLNHLLLTRGFLQKQGRIISQAFHRQRDADGQP
jgi:hypothetical protein